MLLIVHADPDVRVRDIAARAKITERAAQTILTDLEAAGYLKRAKVGRRNRYTINPTGPFRHSAEADHHVGALLEVFSAAAP